MGPAALTSTMPNLYARPGMMGHSPTVDPRPPLSNRVVAAGSGWDLLAVKNTLRQDARRVLRKSPRARGRNLTITLRQKVEDVPSSDRKYRMPLLNFPLEPSSSRATVFKEVCMDTRLTLVVNSPSVDRGRADDDLSIFARSSTSEFHVVEPSLKLLSRYGDANSTNIRCTIIVLESGGLWVHDPIAPSKECLRFIESLGCASHAQDTKPLKQRVCAVRSATRPGHACTVPCCAD
eukprot:2527838-Pyramimonas_sp.AAC.1